MNRRIRWGPAALLSSALALAGCPDATPNPGTTTSSSTGTGGTGGMGTPVLKGEFVGGAVLGKAGGIGLRGQIVWHAKVGGENGGIKLEGWLQ